MKRYQSTGTVIIRVWSIDPENAELCIKKLVDELQKVPGAHISMAEHHQKPGKLALEIIG